MIKPVNAKGLSVQQVQELQEKLIVMAKENVGEVMIMEIGKSSEESFFITKFGQLQFKEWLKNQGHVSISTFSNTFKWYFILGQQVSLWLDVHNKSAKVVKEVKSFASFHEAMEAR